MVRKRINKEITKKIKNYVAELKKDNLPIQQVILFGSHAKGKTHRWSDIDVCIVSPKFKGKNNFLTYLWTKRTKRDALALIAPVGYHPNDFKSIDPLLHEIKKTGIRIM